MTTDNKIFKDLHQMHTSLFYQSRWLFVLVVLQSALLVWTSWFLLERVCKIEQTIQREQRETVPPPQLRHKICPGLSSVAHCPYDNSESNQSLLESGDSMSRVPAYLATQNANSRTPLVHTTYYQSPRPQALLQQESTDWSGSQSGFSG